MPAFAISALSVRQHACLSATRLAAKRLMVRSCWAGVSPSCDSVCTPAATWP